MIKKNLEEFIYLREEELMNMEYPYDRMRVFKKYWNEFKRFCKKNNSDTFDKNMIDKYINSTYGLDGNQKNTREAIRAMEVLINVDNINKSIPYKPKSEDELNDYYKNILKKYLDFYKTVRDNSDTTIKDKRLLTIKFFIYLQDSNIFSIENISKETILNYIEINYKSLNSIRIAINWNLRSLFLYFNDSGILPNNFESLLPKIKRVKQRKIPATFEKEDVVKILDYLKKERGNTPASYRNYAMVILASKLGLRKIDIINLKWNNIDWTNNSINIIQMKTKKQLSLPLANDVGEAIIDYIKNERPFKIREEDEYIFIRHRYPLINLNYNFSLTNIIEKSLIKSGVPKDKYQQKGLHSFRFTIATELLNKNVPAEIISSVLGHSNLNSQKSYTRVNNDNLRKCFVEANYE